ncbi:MAG: SDR family oxidoreductase [Actinomycetota bacterium]|nr:SDR family oxidoreductase [Actinomycetota bacterium]
MELSGKHVVVTGAARGIGAALAQRFHAEGARVVVSDVNVEGVAAVAAGLEATRPGSALAVAADVGTEQGNHDLIDAAETAFGPIDLFFANAGVGVGRSVDDTSERDWQLAFDINVHAHRWAAKYLVPGWVARGEGYFCSTASAAGLLSQIGSAPYSLTKHAAVALAEWLSITYGDAGLRVSCLCPQGVNTAMLSAGDTAGAGISSAVVRSAGRVLEPAEVAEVAVQAIRDETFLILPHAEVLTFAQRKTADYDRWLAGMRKLQARSQGGA